MSKCRYCEYWKKATKREAAEPSKRFCENKNQWVNKEDEICGYTISEFKMSDFFWCDSRMHYRSSLGCIKNQDIEDKCKMCQQGEEVAIAYECFQEVLARRKVKLARRGGP